jgi:hypothetical protein
MAWRNRLGIGLAAGKAAATSSENLISSLVCPVVDGGVDIGADYPARSSAGVMGLTVPTTFRAIDRDGSGAIDAQ